VGDVRFSGVVANHRPASGTSLRHSGTGRRHMAISKVPVVTSNRRQVDRCLQPAGASVKSTCSHRLPQRPLSSSLPHPNNIQVVVAAAARSQQKIKPAENKTGIKKKLAVRLTQRGSFVFFIGKGVLGYRQVYFIYQPLEVFVSVYSLPVSYITSPIVYIIYPSPF